MDFKLYRQEFPIVDRYLFFNNAAISAPSSRVHEAIGMFHRECSEQASRGYRQWTRRLEDVRSSAARLLGADASEVAFTGNTSSGLAMAAEGFDWREGDEVLVPIPDFPANVYPWQHLERRGVGVRFVARRAGRLDVDDFAAALTPRSRMLVVSSVDYASGFSVDLAALGSFCREKGLIFGVDAIQGLGALPIDVKACGIHFLAAGGHKWMLGPVGTGIFFIDRSSNELFDPPLVGWRSVIDEENFELDFRLKEDVRRFENGTLNLGGLFGLGAALELLEEVGIEAIRRRIFELGDRLFAEMQGRGLIVDSPSDYGERSGIFVFRPPGDPERCFRHLLQRNVMLSLRQGRLRLAPHFYNNEDDIDDFIAILDEFIQASSNGR